MKKKNIAIIQARMNSSRLPGKMLKKIGKYSIIEWVIKRLKKAKSIEDDNLEQYRTDNPAITDNFKKLHDTLHNYEKFLKQK